MEFDAGRYDVAVIGAGHAGIEAGLACARMGLKTVVFTINLDAVGNMPCNPAIGGTGKGHLVRELDALGGEMAKAADRSCIQYRMLNLGKGPAVHSLRAQADRRRYQEDMKRTLERQENLDLKQAMITSLRLTDGQVSAVSARCIRCAPASLPPVRIWMPASSPATAPMPPARTGCRRASVLRSSFLLLACVCAGSRPARRRASTAARST